ncbi:MAG: HD family phosphohydrolase [Alphaproteobacteria bacterium]
MTDAAGPPGASSPVARLREERRLLSAGAIRALAEDHWQRARPWLDWPLLLLFILAMTVLFAPLAQSRLSVPPPDSIATQTVRASRAVLAEDVDATQLKREQALAQVRPQFDYDPELMFQRRDQVMTAFDRLEERRAGAGHSFEERRALFEADLGQPVNVVVFTRLEALAEPGDAAAAIVFFLNTVLDRRIVADRALLPERGAIELRRDASGPSAPLFDTGAILDQAQAWRLMRARAGEAPYGAARGVRNWIVETALALASPNLRPDDAATRAARAAALDAVQPVMMRIGRGEVIVRDGDRVTPLVRARIAALNEAGGDYLGWVDSLVFAASFACLIGLGAFYFYRARVPMRFTRKSAYITLSATLLASGVIVAVWFAGRAFVDAFGIEPGMAALLPPVAFGSVLVAMLVNARASLMVGVALALLAAYRADGDIWIALYHLIGVLVAGIVAQRCRQRFDLLKLGLVVALAQAAAVPAVLTLGGAAPGVDYLVGVAFGLASGVMVAAFATAAIPLFEQLFNEVTPFRLMELASIGHPTLKKLALHSPGTYHHSVMIANLAEAAADAIGANALQCRVMALYHDIGKGERPVYFIENQRDGNIHDGLAPEVSARIIFSHITDGIMLARKHRLGRPVIDAITQHQGTTLLRLFYQRAVERAAARGETVSEDDYRYPGPKPSSRESGIIMLADSTEAATRALKSPTPPEVRARVAQVINGKLADGQLADCALTIADLAKIEEAFARILVLGVYHSRIEYPPLRAAGPAPRDAARDEPRHDRDKAGAPGLAERAP